MTSRTPAEEPAAPMDETDAAPPPPAAPPEPCPHPGCPGILFRSQGGWTECTNGHTTGVMPMIIW